MKYIKLYEDFQLGDLNFMSPEEIQDLFMRECAKDVPDLELIKVILDNGLVDVNANNDSGQSPLHWAVDKNNIALAELLISAGADVKAKDIDGESPLHQARSVTIAELLISAGAKVNAEDYEDGWSPLHWAVLMGNIALAEYLISAGADVNSKNEHGCSPLHYAKSVEIAKLLISAGADVNAGGYDGDTPLHFAVSGGNIDIAELLISAGADVNAEDNGGILPFEYANSEEMKALLKKHGAVE